MQAIPFSYDYNTGELRGSGEWAHVCLVLKPHAAMRILNKLRYAMSAADRKRKPEDEILRVLEAATVKSWITNAGTHRPPNT
jgi:hypothetical protein